MAIAVIGGIIVSTVLSLVVVPSFFQIMDDLSRVLAWVFSRFVGQKEAEPKAPDPLELAAGMAESQSEIERLRDRIADLEHGSGSWNPAIPRHVAE
jgi:hypothetical protein